MNRSCTRIALTVTLALVIVGGCKFSKGPTIAEILAEPAKYEGKTVSVKGTVSSPVQMFGKGICKLSDATDTLTVVTAKSHSEGEETTIRGTLETAFNLGTKTVVVLVEEGAKDTEQDK